MLTRFTFAAVVLLSAAVADAQDRNTELIQSVAVKMIDGLSNASETQNQNERYQKLVAFTKEMEKPYWSVTIHLSITEVNRDRDGVAVTVNVSHASELPDNLPKDISYTSTISLHRFSKDVADKLAVGDSIVVSGPLIYQGRNKVGRGEFIVLGIPMEQSGRLVLHRLCIGDVDRKISTSLD